MGSVELDRTRSVGRLELAPGSSAETPDRALAPEVARHGADRPTGDVTLQPETFESEERIDDEFPSEEQSPRRAAVNSAAVNSATVNNRDHALFTDWTYATSDGAETEYVPPAAGTWPAASAEQQRRAPLLFGLLGVGVVVLAAVVGFVVTEFSQTEVALPNVTTRAPIEISPPPTGPTAAAPVAGAIVPGANSDPVDSVPEPPLGPTTTAPPEASRASSAGGAGLSGWWSVTNRIESSAEAEGERLNVGYRLLLTQDGNRISGTGRKWMENGRSLPTLEQSTVAVDGVIQGRTIQLRLTERGSSPAGAGTLTLNMTDRDVLQGSFTNQVTQSTGSTQARRTSSP